MTLHLLLLNQLHFIKTLLKTARYFQMGSFLFVRIIMQANLSWNHLLNKRTIAIVVELNNRDNSAMNSIKESLNWKIYSPKTNVNLLHIAVKVNSAIPLTTVRLQSALLKGQGHLKISLLIATTFTSLNNLHSHPNYYNQCNSKMISILLIQFFLKYHSSIT